MGSTRQVDSEGVKAACPVPFDEGRLWKGADGPELKAQLQGHFRNITSAMDCVGCEKCKLWGKLQLLGARPTQSRVLSCQSGTGGTVTHWPHIVCCTLCRIPAVGCPDQATSNRGSASSSTSQTAGQHWPKLDRCAGIATSLKVLFSADDCGGVGSGQALQLERNEVIAMLNLLERLSASIEVVREMSMQLVDAAKHPRGLGAIEDMTHESLKGVL